MKVIFTYSCEVAEFNCLCGNSIISIILNLDMLLIIDLIQKKKLYLFIYLKKIIRQSLNKVIAIYSCEVVRLNCYVGYSVTC